MDKLFTRLLMEVLETLPNSVLIRPPAKLDSDPLWILKTRPITD